MNETQTSSPLVSSGRVVLYLVLAVIGILGLKEILATLSDGHIHTATTQHVPWGLLVAFYIFFLGLSAGSFLLSTLVYVFRVKTLEPVGPLALLQAIGCLALGGILIMLDLGHPERMYMVLLSPNPTSVMTFMGFFYNAYILIMVVELYFALRPRCVQLAQAGGAFGWWYRLLALGSNRLDEASLARDRKWLMVFGLLGIPAAVTVHGGVGAIFAVAKARPNWFSGLFPIIFLMSALASGGALLAFFTAAFSHLPKPQKSAAVRMIMYIALGILVLDLQMLASEILVTFYGGVPHEVAGWRLTLFGPYWWVFWFIQLGVGLVVPIGLMCSRQTLESFRRLATAGFCMVVGILGGRLNLVIPPQIQPTFDSLPEAYHHLRWEVGYFPSMNEWWTGLGVMALGMLAFLVARKLLPLEEAEQVTAQSPVATGGES